MASEGGAAHKNIFIYPKGIVNQVKEDEIRKKLYENERKARETWEQKWSFLKNSKIMRIEEAQKRNLPPDIFEKQNNQRKPPAWPKERQLKIKLLPSERVPPVSSGMIGWRSSVKENNINLLSGLLYVSRKVSADPPLSPNEPDLKQQRFIFLG